MTIIRPFRGVRYNPACFERLDVVVSQPYDRIGQSLAEQYRSLSPYNITGIILGHDEDDAPPDKGHGYDHAKAAYDRWLADGILIREQSPALYAYEQTFSVEGQTYVRLGVISAVRLTEFEEGIILPHERTHEAPKTDRLQLIKTLKVNPELVFILYPDPENQVNAVLRQAIQGRKPDIDVVEFYENDVRQRVWVITEPDIIRAVEHIMAPKRGLIIADGHHRYETALNYRRQQVVANPTLPPDAACNFIGAALVSMDDPGLVVLPTHREIRNFGGHTPKEVLARAAVCFNVSPGSSLEETLGKVNADASGRTFGFYGGQTVGYHTLTLEDHCQVETLIDDDRSPAWKSLAVSIAHRILLERIAEVPAAGINDKSMVRYHRDPLEPVRSIDAGAGEFVIFLSPTSMAQIKGVAGHGEKMPQKSTDFYPKVISGLTMLPVGPHEILSEVAQEERA